MLKVSCMPISQYLRMQSVSYVFLVGHMFLFVFLLILLKMLSDRSTISHFTTCSRTSSGLLLLRFAHTPTHTSLTFWHNSHMAFHFLAPSLISALNG